MTTLSDGVWVFKPPGRLMHYPWRIFAFFNLPVRGVPGQARFRTDRADADDQSVDPQAAPAAAGAQQGSRAGGVPSKAWRMHARLYDDAEEAELGASQGRPRAPDQR